MKCPKCAYVRQPSDDAPNWQCPSCKVAYIKVLRALEAARLAQQTQPQPQPVHEQAYRHQVRTEALPPASDDLEFEAEEQLWDAAKGQKILVHCILLNLATTALGGTLAARPLVAFALYACITIYALGGLVRIGSGLGMSQGAKIGLLILAFVPLLSLVSMLYLSGKATALLRRAGWSVGLMGARP